MKNVNKRITIEYGDDGAASFFQVTGTGVPKPVTTISRKGVDQAIQHIMWPGREHAANKAIDCPVCAERADG